MDVDFDYRGGGRKWKEINNISEVKATRCGD